MTARCAFYMGALKIFESPWVRPRLLFPKCLMGFCSDRSSECAYKIEVRSFTRSWDIRDSLRIQFWVGVANLRTPNFAEEEVVWGRGWYRSKERW